MSSFDVFCGCEEHLHSFARAVCFECQVIWHFNTVRGARVFAQTHANECGECHIHGAVSDHFHRVHDEPPAPEAWGPPDVVARELGEWEEMVARATSEKARASRRKMVDRERRALELSAEALEVRHPGLSVDRRTGQVSIR